jgi:hypothetical protein
MLGAATAAALAASGFAINVAAQSDQKPTHEELVQHWAEAAIDAQLKGMKSSLRLPLTKTRTGPRLNPQSRTPSGRAWSP